MIDLSFIRCTLMNKMVNARRLAIEVTGRTSSWCGRPGQPQSHTVLWLRLCSRPSMCCGTHHFIREAKNSDCLWPAWWGWRDAPCPRAFLSSADRASGPQGPSSPQQSTGGGVGTPGSVWIKVVWFGGLMVPLASVKMKTWLLLVFFDLAGVASSGRLCRRYI
jgi:hypothetical protein